MCVQVSVLLGMMNANESICVYECVCVYTCITYVLLCLRMCTYARCLFRGCRLCSHALLYSYAIVVAQMASPFPRLSQFFNVTCRFSACNIENLGMGLGMRLTNDSIIPMAWILIATYMYRTKGL